MGHEQDAAAELEQLVLEPLDHLDVEVVGGLVEEQQVGLADERLRERDPAAPAARERAERRVGRKLEPREDLVDPLAHTPAAAHFELVLQRIHARELRGVFARRVRHAVELREESAELREPAGDDLEDGGRIVRGRILRERRDLQAGHAPDRARIRCDLAAHDLEQGRLARAVAPDQAHALAGVDLQARAVEERLRAERDRYAVEAQERDCAAPCSRASSAPPSRSRRSSARAAGSGTRPPAFQWRRSCLRRAATPRGSSPPRSRIASA